MSDRLPSTEELTDILSSFDAAIHASVCGRVNIDTRDLQESVAFMRAALKAQPVAVAAVPDEPLGVFDDGPWFLEKTGQSFSGKQLDEAAFSAYHSRLSAAPGKPAAPTERDTLCQGAALRIPTRPRCHRCQRYITIDTDADNDLWQEVIGARFGAGYICADCFTRAADERLIKWEGRVRLVPYSLASQTVIQMGHTRSPKDHEGG